MKTKIRSLQQRISARETSDGDGVRMYRIAGQRLNEILDPFLLLDEFRSDDSADYIGGFPAHPHRGFETVTYMLKGKMRHRDHMGNEGLLEDGGLQWMTAGRGVIHSEMPEQTDGLLHGFQLWLNLPASEKMKPAHYQDFRATDLPVVELDDGGELKLVAGQINDPVSATGPVKGVVTEPTYIHLDLPANKPWHQHVAEDHTVLLYVYEGATSEIAMREMGVYVDGNEVSITAGKDGMKAILLAARPLHEPVRQYGPFVMNTEQEINRAIDDYRSGRLTDG